MSKSCEPYKLSSMNRFSLKKIIAKETGRLSDYLAAETGLSKARIKDAMNKGAVWLGWERKKLKRLRKATAELRSGMRIEFHYDEKLLALIPPQARFISDRNGYSVW
ncbi:MAG TPA: hypothetical protein VK448_06660, partial [Dissulfurispiraceae bacterium]|nr:hypothetical protein [Dissulfurispiraceae bacterium]